MTRKTQTGLEVWRTLLRACLPGTRRRHHPPIDAERVECWVPRTVVRRLEAQLRRLQARTGRTITRSEFERLALTTWVERLEAVSDHELAGLWARTALRDTTQSVPGARPRA